MIDGPTYALLTESGFLHAAYVDAASRLLTNVAVDLGAIGGSLFLVKQDLDAQRARLARMEIGAKLAGLKVRLQARKLHLVVDACHASQTLLV